MKEIWKDIKGYNGRYQISNLGRIRSFRILKSKTQLNGYMFIGLRKDGKSHNHRLHRLVAEAFIENPDNLSEINHKDHNKQNNNVENIEWITHTKNIQYDYDSRFRKTKSNISTELLLELKNLYDNTSITYRELGEQFGVSRQAIYKRLKKLSTQNKI